MISDEMITGFCGVVCIGVLWMMTFVGDIDVANVGVIVTAGWCWLTTDLRASKLFFLLSFLSFIDFWNATNACFIGAEKFLNSISLMESSTSWALNVLWLCLCAKAAAFDDKYMINTDVARAIAMRASANSKIHSMEHKEIG